MSESEAWLMRRFRDMPEEFGYRYSEEARTALLRDLFNSLACHHREYLTQLFGDVPRGSDPHVWKLSAAQGAVEGAEYSAAARGKVCGHIFKHGEATYRCKTCALDDTCVLCSRCFDASDHEGHSVFVNISPGNSGCCDCGDSEAWKIPVKCAIHTATTTANDAPSPMEMDSLNSTIAPDFARGIRNTIARALDYVCDVISCSPEQLKLAKTEATIKKDEEQSRLTSPYYGVESESDNIEFCLVLWNDEKHTLYDVRDQVARACKEKKEFGRARAYETDSIGRSLVVYSHDINELLRIARIIEQIKVTVTIRSARDTFREQMVGTIIEWLEDIAGCSAGGDSKILRNTICEELLSAWRVGSKASNTEVGRDGIYDHAYQEEAQHAYMERRLRMPIGLIAEPEDEMDVEEDVDLDNIDAGVREDHEDDDDDDDHGEVDDEDVDMIGSGVASQDEDDGIGTNFIRQALRFQEFGELPALARRNDEPMEVQLQGIGAPRIPNTPRPIPSRLRSKSPAPRHWLEKPGGFVSREPLPPHEDLSRLVRLDYLIKFDLRLWKKVRVDLRDLYISTVVAIPEFKRILGLRFAALYTTLSQLYLIADREPDHSIINLSLQMLTTPSITAEVVKRGNFLTNLIAILYTFLTTRQVSYPHQVDPNATLAFDTGSVMNPLTNRRMYHFFHDMKYLFGSEHVQEQLRNEPRYTLQFLDLVRLHQGICPNVRAVTEHVEYEAEAWLSASLITREINKLTKQFAEAFKVRDGSDTRSLQRTLAICSKYAIVNSMGWERRRFQQAEMKAETEFKEVGGFEFDTDRWGHPHYYKIVRFSVDRQPISFHHALHYTVSWLIEAGKDMDVTQLRSLLSFSWEQLQPEGGPEAKEHEPEDYQLAMFDLPLRVCVWLAQIKAGMWVRNGFSLKHQMQTYRSVSQRDLSHNRDIFLLQTAFVTINPSRVLVNMIDRFNLNQWMEGNYVAPTGYDESQALDLTEEFLHMLIIILSDRLPLIPTRQVLDIQVLKIRRELVHTLCFKPMQFSELTSRLPERLQDHEKFHEILREMTNFRAPEGLSDSGTFELKDEYLDEVDPYIMQFTKNQREETENLYRARMAKKTGKPESDVVFEPHLRPIESGIFSDVTAFTRTSIFAQIIYYSLAYATQFKTVTPHIQDSRVEMFLQLCLHLCQLAVLEDRSTEENGDEDSFVYHALKKESKNAPPSLWSTSTFVVEGSDNGCRTIATVLHRLASIDEFKACWPKIFHILRVMREKRPNTFSNVASWATEMGINLETDENKRKEDEAERKKQLAKERQAKIMAQMKEQQQKFMSSVAEFDFDEDSGAESDHTLAAEEQKLWKYPTGTCILCQEEMNDSRIYGTLALVMESNILRQTDLTDAEYVYETVKNPESLDRPADDIRPFGVAAMNRDRLRRLAPDGSEVVVERQGLGRGFPSSATKRGPVAVGCNHLMHFSCFEHYYEATRRRHPHQIARNHPEKLERQEFVCPLCKALGNAFLPIIWRAKEETLAGVLQPGKCFENWLEDLGPSVSRLEKVVDGAGSRAKTQEMFRDYGKSQVIAPLANRLVSIPSTNQESKFPDLGGRISPSLPAFATQGFAPMMPDLNALSRPVVASATPNELDELQKIYRRLRDTYKDNSIFSTYAGDGFPWVPKSPELSYSDSLARTLGYSISALEIAQRGVGSDIGSTLLDRISPQVLTHIRILSETVSSYYAVGCLQSRDPTKTMIEFQGMEKEQMQRLFFGHQQMFDDFVRSKAMATVEPLLCSDLFVFLAECSVCLTPAMGWDVMHILRLCYIAEIVKAIVAIGRDCDFTEILRGWERAERLGEVEGRIGYTESQLDLFKRFVEFISSSFDGPGDFANVSSFSLAVFRHMIGQYATPFLRKCVIFLHARYGVLFPPAGFADVDEPELYRLSQALRLPSIDEIFESCLDESGDFMCRIITGWCHHLAVRRGTVSLSHPAIFELVGLPAHFDVLVEEATKRKCPSSGKDLSDPCACLFCGEIFCSQAECCTKEVENETKIGGCNRHMRKCGKDVGIFINIRKCCLIYLHNQNGTYAAAPYMDIHGETDIGLRRSRQLFLNQRRYDALVRNAWLVHGIPSIISRKLEAEMNTGGWESL